MNTNLKESMEVIKERMMKEFMECKSYSNSKGESEMALLCMLLSTFDQIGELYSDVEKLKQELEELKKSKEESQK